MTDKTSHPRRRPALPLALTVAALAAITAGCASVPTTIASDVSSFGEWPGNRSAGTYAFERLPSQQARAQDQAVIEAAARGAVERAGFKPAANEAQADVLIQLSARSMRQDRGSGYDPIFWPRVHIGGGYRYWGWGWGVSAPLPSTPRARREVAVLIRDRTSGKTVYETRALNNGSADPDSTLLTAMFDAALKDFPKPAISPRRVDVIVQPSSQGALPTAGTPPAAAPTPVTR
jgi:hypothetical protein